MIEYLCLVILVAFAVKFLQTLADKWGVIDWLQFHSPNDFFYKLFSCDFCRSFHLGMVISIVLVFVLHDWRLLFIPVFSSSLR